MPKRITKGPTDAELIATLFKPEEIETNLAKYETLEGRWVVLKPTCLSEQHRTRYKLLWKATGGFGCNPTGRGGALYAKCFEDGEESRWEGPRLDVFGVFVGELPTAKRKFLVRVERVSVQYKDVEVEAVSVDAAKKEALELTAGPMGFSQPDIKYEIDSISEEK